MGVAGVGVRALFYRLGARIDVSFAEALLFVRSGVSFMSCCCSRLVLERVVASQTPASTVSGGNSTANVTAGKHA